MSSSQYDRIIIGGGLYGLYAALFCGRRSLRVLVLEHDGDSCQRATYVNQARVHMGYHYPRSYSTAVKSARYFERFIEDYEDCILSDFQQIYATSSSFSYTNAHQFRKFCEAAGIPCEEVPTSWYFKEEKCDGAFLTREYTYDASLMRKKLMAQIDKLENVEVRYNARIQSIRQEGEVYVIADRERFYSTPFILNATYASTNQILNLLGYSTFGIKYELCEIILCNVNDKLKGIGLTVMDGPFFSIMPFGKTGFHSLTSVTFTPHMTSYENLPVFDCQKQCEPGYCSAAQLGNCNTCAAKPKSAWPYMSNLAKKYMKEDLSFEYVGSLFSMKPILKASEIDDSRPTVIRVNHTAPTFVSVLSGKINTVYDLDEVLI